MEITALLSALNSALAEPFALVWSQDSPRFLLVFTVVYAVAVIVAVTDQKNTRPGAEHGSAAWGDVFRLNKFYMDKHGPNLLLTQHFHIGIYPNLYARKQSEEDVREGLPTKYGFHTNISTKPMIISTLVKVIRENLYTERDERCLDEYLCYEKKPNGAFWRNYR